MVLVLSSTPPRAEVRWKRGTASFAARTPGHEGLFATDQTPVNIFAPMLDRYLGIDVPRQPDTSYLGYLELTPLQAVE